MSDVVPTFEEWALICPQWAKDLAGQKIPLVVGLPVFDTVLAGKEGRGFGVIRSVNRDRVVIEYATGELMNSAAVAFVPDLTDKIGRSYYQWYVENFTSLPPTKSVAQEYDAKNVVLYFKGIKITGFSE